MFGATARARRIPMSSSRAMITPRTVWPGCPHFTRVEPRRRVREFVLGLMAGLPCTDCWTIAEHAGKDGPGGMQHLLNRAVWDHDAVRTNLRGYVVDNLAAPQAVLVVDENRGREEGHRDRRGPAAVHRHGRSDRERPGLVYLVDSPRLRRHWRLETAGARGTRCRRSTIEAPIASNVLREMLPAQPKR